MPVSTRSRSHPGLRGRMPTRNGSSARSGPRSPTGADLRRRAPARGPGRVCTALRSPTHPQIARWSYVTDPRSGESLDHRSTYTRPVDTTAYIYSPTSQRFSAMMTIWRRLTSVREADRRVEGQPARLTPWSVAGPRPAGCQFVCPEAGWVRWRRSAASRVWRSAQAICPVAIATRAQTRAHIRGGCRVLPADCRDRVRRPPPAAILNLMVTGSGGLIATKRTPHGHR
ncbi:hypothetical protein FrEUN1fDRAFT_4631 [Parafrankia sp. EUN1f]|nr:hypothetical protein FrEUN1fDRAFT_4631 [Parafrankia sp. EUN1f]